MRPIIAPDRPAERPDPPLRHCGRCKSEFASESCTCGCHKNPAPRPVAARHRCDDCGKSHVVESLARDCEKRHDLNRRAA